MMEAMVVRLILRLLAVMWLPAAGAEPLDMLFRNWNSHHGLPQDHIRAMVRTRDGFLWLGTDAGLARFDGSAFQTYGLREGLKAVAVLALLEASDGALWIGTLGGGVSVLRNGRIEASYTREHGLPAASVSSLAEDENGRIWVAGSYWLQDGRFVPVPGARYMASTVFRARDGTLWMNSGGVRILRWKAGQWSEGSEGGPVAAGAFCEDPAGRLWIADERRRLWCRGAEGWSSWDLPREMQGRVSSLAAAADGTVWMALYRSGLGGFREGTFIEPRTETEKFMDLAEIVFCTPDGLLWLGTSTNGLYSLAQRRIALARVEDSKTQRGSNFIGALLETAPGEFLIGTQGQGLFRWKNGQSTPVREVGNYNQDLFANALLRSRDGVIRAGTARGIFEFRGTAAPGALLQPLAPFNVWDFCEDRQGGLWIGCGNGDLYYQRDGALKKIDYGNGGGYPVKGLAQTQDGALWIGSRGNGLFRLHEGASQRFGTADGLLSEVIRVLHVTQDGTLWVGTLGGGLAIHRAGRFHSLTTADGLPDDIISQIAEDAQGRLWLGTNRGLAVLAQSELAMLKEGGVRKFHPLVIDHADGFMPEECTIVPPVKMSDGRMAFATTHGFAMLQPEQFQANPVTPPVFIERVLANGEEVKPHQGTLSLPPGLERLEIEYTALDFTAPKRLRFSSRLGGIDHDWSEATPHRYVEYRNLAPGSHLFEVAGSLGNGRWSPAPATLHITLAPHFWQTLGFRIAAGLAAVGIVAAVARWREHLRSRRKIELLKREQAVQEERARIARDLHDDVGASLTQVALLSELADSDLSDSSERAREHINEIFTTAKEMTRSLDEIVWAVNPAQDRLESFAAFLGTFVQNYARTARLTARLDIPEVLPEIPLSSAIRHHLYLATKEVLHNVAKHADATEIRLHLIPEPEGIRLVIQDNGKGIPRNAPARGHDGDGMQNFVQRLEQIGGTCTLVSEPGCGTRIEMYVPLALSAAV